MQLVVQIYQCVKSMKTPISYWSITNQEE